MASIEVRAGVLPAAALLLMLAGCSSTTPEDVKDVPTEAVQVEAGPTETAAPAVSDAGAAGDDCPSVEELTETITATFRKGITVKEVGPGPFPGICETVISFQGRPDILYSDRTGRYFVTGRSVGIVDAREKINLTREKISEFNRFTAEDMEKVASLTALSMGNKGPIVYFVTDPQ